MTERIEPVGPRRGAAPVERVLLTPVERELRRREREERRRRRRDRAPDRDADGDTSPRLDFRV